MQNLSYENEFDLHENVINVLAKHNFISVNGSAQGLVLKERQKITQK